MDSAPRNDAVHESGAGTKLPTWDVRPTIAIGGKATASGLPLQIIR